jgi:Capsule assembly protein Wzi
VNTIRLILFLLVLNLFRTNLHAQTGASPATGAYHASLEAQGVLTTSDQVPFWMRSDQFGSIPLPGTTASVIGAARKNYDSARTRLVDWSGSLEVRADMGSSSRATLIEGYAGLRVSIFELKAGRSKEFMGLVDSSLSSGAFSISGNALGIPKVSLAIPEYWTLPFLRGLFALKGSFAHGWLGEQAIASSTTVHEANTWFHQSSLYGRFGRPDWKLKLYAGINHQVFWGSEHSVFGDMYKLSGLKTYEYVVLGLQYEGSKVGNHLGSVDMMMQYDFPQIRLTAYRQFFYDEGALAHLANLADGLNGLSITNLTETPGGFKWNKILVEFFYSKDQAGYPNSKPTPSGDENYYNNYEYLDGWSYKGLGLGSPFATTYPSTRTGLPNNPKDYFNNNRVVAGYLGMEGALEGFYFTTRLSYSFNYGTFGTSIYGFSTGSRRYASIYGIFQEVDQFSAFLEIKKALSRGWQAGVAAALDNGHLLYNSTGLILKLKKSF